jgi:OHCU decarboxylase
MTQPAASGLDALNRLDDVTLARQLHRCCGSSAWVQGILAARPFRTHFDLRDAADRVWQALLPIDWMEAFAAHPRIGEHAASGWAAGEQAAARGARATTLEELAAANRAYAARFGHLFVVCATGKTAEEMLALLRDRLDHDADTELAVAAEEQRKITRLRLDKLLAELADR